MSIARDRPGAPTILVVDDQPGMRWVISRILRDAEYAVETAESAVEALAISQNGGFAAAIVDYRLPDQNGLDLFRRFRAARISIPMILITSYGSAELREEALALGFTAYFDKPLNLEVLLATLREAVEEQTGEKDA